MPHLHRRFGEAFTVRLVPRPLPLVLFTGADQAREVFAGDPATFQAGRANALLGPIMGPHSLLLVDGAEHRRARRLLMPAFRASAMAGYRILVTGLAREEVARWPLGTELRSLERMNGLTLEVILRVVFGVADEQRLARLRPLVGEVVRVNPVVMLGWGYPVLLRFRPWRRVAEVLRQLDEVLYAEIAERRTVPGLEHRSDVLSQLLLVGDAGNDGAGDQPVTDQPLTNQELRDQLLTLLLAGHETTAAGLAWALYELGRDPDLMRRAQAAADGQDQADDDFLEAVFKESLRLHTIIPMVVRHLTGPATIGGRRLATGTAVGPSMLLMHGDPAYFPEPQRFRPERFLDGEVAPGTWVPFGGGVRRCIGAGFALMEGVAVLREVLSAVDLTVDPRHLDKPRVRNITSIPGRGARIRVSSRS